MKGYKKLAEFLLRNCGGWACPQEYELDNYYREDSSCPYKVIKGKLSDKTEKVFFTLRNNTDICKKCMIKALEKNYIEKEQ